MAIKTSSQIIDDALMYINGLTIAQSVDISNGTILKDIVIDSPATVLGDAYTTLQQIQKASSVNYIDELTDTQVDDLAVNWNLTRKEGAKATGSVVFYKYQQPTTTITISSGTIVTTGNNDNGISYSFSTMETKTSADMIYNSARQRWEVEIIIQANDIGSDYNVGNQAIQQYSGINGIDGVINYNACSGGLDKETNSALGERIIEASKARLLGTKPGYKTLIDSNSSVIDSNVIDTTMTNYIRNTYGNEVDIIIIGNIPTIFSEKTTYNPLTGNTYIFKNQPVSSISSISGFTQGIDYRLSIDETTDYRYSSKAEDKLEWLSGGRHPNSGEEYTINYTYNGLITDLQQLIDDEENHLLGSDVLIRQGIELQVEMKFHVYTYSGTNTTNMQQQIINVIQQYINNLKLGEKLEQSDILYELRSNLDFIDNIDLPFEKFNIIGSSISVVNKIEPTKYQYLRIDSSNITIEFN